MRRGAKPGKAKVVTKRPRPRTSPKDEASKRHDLEKRLAESLEREKAKDRALTEVLEQQTATSEILRVISSSRTDVQPVFDAIARHAVALCDGVGGMVVRYDGAVMRLAAFHNVSAKGRELHQTEYPRPPDRTVPLGAAIVDRTIVHVPNLQASTRFAGSPVHRSGRASMIAVPLLRHGEAIGAIGITRDEPEGFSDRDIALLQTFADQAVIAIENVRLFNETKERLEQQTATAEILRVISSSPMDVQPVFEAIVTGAARLCDAVDGTILLVDGDKLVLVAHEGPISSLPIGPFGALTPGRPSTRAVLEARTIHVVDLQAEVDEYPEGSASARSHNFRTVLNVPLVRAGAAIGVIVIRRTEARPFTERQTELLQTFADQAVIAIENVRLFKELEARNHDLTSTSEVLRVISTSPTNVQPVFDAIVESAVRLCDARYGAVFSYDGELVHLAAHHNFSEEALAGVRQQYPMPPSRGHISGRAILTGATIQIPDIALDAQYGSPLATQLGYRSLLGVPILRGGAPIGAIVIYRKESGPFTDKYIALLQTFADQAVIAIENVRLFDELQSSNRELTTALDQQTATSDILKVISRSQTDVQPVFDAIASNARRLCNGSSSAVFTFDGELIHLAALEHFSAKAVAAVRGAFPMPPGRGSAAARAILTRRIAQITDAGEEADYALRDATQIIEFRSVLAVPMLRDGHPIGAISVGKAVPGAFPDSQLELLQTFADQAVIAIENVRLFNETKEALEQQTATSEILGVISSSPTDIQPVLDAVSESAARLCEAYDAVIYRLADDRLVLAAHHGPIPVGRLGETWLPLGRGTANGRAMLEARTVHVADQQAEVGNFPEGSEIARQRGYRTLLVVPLVRDGVPIGTIGLRRTEVRLFTERQVSLLQTFSDQAVIAIENVRLFNELQERNRALTQAHAQITETLDQQTATSEVLKVIAGSPTDLQPVLDTLVESAGRLCQAADTFLLLIEGDQLRVAALHGAVDDGARLSNAIHRGWVAGRAVVDARTVHVEDLANAEAEFPLGAAIAARFGHRTALAIPLLRKGVPIGALFLRRREVRQFSDKEIALLETFADQAVIAIENVRLFTELQEKNQALTEAHAQISEALEQQTATSEILRVIASSPTDLQPVLDALAESASRLCRSVDCNIFLPAGDRLVLRARYGPSRGEADVVGQFVLALVRGTVAGRTVLERRTVHVIDLLAEADEFPEAHQNARRFGFRTMLSVPLIRESAALGVIQLRRTEVNPFTDRQAELLKTFADQAVIAIENVRLFTELQASNRDLTSALDTQTATSDILRVISQSQTDVQPVFDAILSSAVRLLRGYSGAVTRLVGDQITLAAATSSDDAGDASLRRIYPQSLQSETANAQAIRDRAPLNIADAQADPRLPDASHAAARARGFRSLVTVPLLGHDEAVGTISVMRRDPGGFSDDEIALLKTFADQAVIAIENVRLFNELEGRNRDLTAALEQQTATSEILRVISSSPMDVQPTFEAIAAAATTLCAAENAGVFLFDGGLIHFAAHHRWTAEDLDAIRHVFPRPPGRGSVTARAILTRAVAHVPDLRNDPDYEETSIILAGFRAVLSVPMLRDGQPIGAINVTRREPIPFSDTQIALLETFARQAVIAVENVRLFKELQARTGELTQSVEKLTALGDVSQALSSTLDVETVLDTIVSRASQLAGADGCVIYEYDKGTEQFHVRATHNLEPTFEDTIRRMSIRKGEGVGGRAAELREPVQVADMTQPGAYESSIRDVIIQAGYRAALAVPLLREDEVIGSLTLTRKTPGEFSPEIVETLKTFATQSALAIQNARLFREIADKSRQLEAASRHKSEFLANMSHELRTPLNAIIGFSEVLVDRMFGELNEKQEEYLKDIYASGQHLLSLINDILDLSKIEAGRMELELTDFDLPSAIDNALILVRERATRRGITLGHSVDERLGSIRADERKVKQVLLNLLSNALKFTPEGGRIDVSAGVNNGVAEIAVADTGVGIAPEDQEAVFEEFRQVGTADKKVEGTGLGLALSRKFIELHGGRIWVQSQVGHGSTFTFTLPVRREE